MDLLTKKEYEEFLITIDFQSLFQSLEVNNSFVVTCFNLNTNVDESDTMLFYEDSSYGEGDYGSGRYGGVPDNEISSVTFGVKGGTVGTNYEITAKVTTDLGIYEKEIILVIADKVEGFVEKQPSEKFTISLDYINSLKNEDIRYDDTIYSQETTAIKKSDGSVVTGSVIYSSGLNGLYGVKIGIQAGVDLEKYQIINKIVSTLGYKYQLDVLMIVKEK